MTRQEVLEKTIKVIHDCNPELEDKVLDENSVVNTDIGLDSMGFILIVCKLEALFNIRIPDQKWQKLTTLGDVVDEIMSRME